MELNMLFDILGQCLNFDYNSKNKKTAYISVDSFEYFNKKLICFLET